MSDLATGPWAVVGVPWEHNTNPRVWTHPVHTSIPGLGHEARGRTQAEVIQHAHLIAAAPDLLKALTEAQVVMRRLSGLAWTGSRIPADRYPEHAQYIEADKVITAAIARARGAAQ